MPEEWKETIIVPISKKRIDGRIIGDRHWKMQLPRL
jgi:hypothetical protein